MPFYRSHRFTTSDFDPVSSTVQAWERDHAESVPGYEGVWITNDLDNPDFWYVTLECSSKDAFAGTNLGNIQLLTERLADTVGGTVKHMDAEDVSSSEPKGSQAGPSKVFTSAIFTVTDPQQAQEIVEAWASARLAQVPGFEGFWLVRGQSETEWQGVSAQFSSRKDLEEGGVSAFTDLLSELSGLLKGEPERHNVTGGVGVPGGE
jgi:hypothetical protein